MDDRENLNKLEALGRSVQGLEVSLAGLRPVVNDIHSAMPRVTEALEMLAKVAERQESNLEDHKRIHYRITDNERDINEVKDDMKDLRHDFDQLHVEHIGHITEKKVKGEVERDSAWGRIRRKAEDETVKCAIVLLLAFAVFTFGPRVIDFVATVPAVMNGLAAEAEGTVK